MLSDALHWFINLIEVIGVIAAILVIGLIAAVLVLWISGKLAGPPPELDQDPEDPTPP